jgi:hypothetical protein
VDDDILLFSGHHRKLLVLHVKTLPSCSDLTGVSVVVVVIVFVFRVPIVPDL